MFVYTNLISHFICIGTDEKNFSYRGILWIRYLIPVVFIRYDCCQNSGSLIGNSFELILLCCAIYIRLGGIQFVAWKSYCFLKYNFQKKGHYKICRRLLTTYLKKEIKHVLRHILRRIEWLPMSSVLPPLFAKGSL